MSSIGSSSLGELYSKCVQLATWAALKQIYPTLIDRARAVYRFFRACTVGTMYSTDIVHAVFIFSTLDERRTIHLRSYMQLPVALLGAGVIFLNIWMPRNYRISDFWSCWKPLRSLINWSTNTFFKLRVPILIWCKELILPLNSHL